MIKKFKIFSNNKVKSSLCWYTFLGLHCWWPGPRVPWWWYSWIQSNCKFVIWRLHATQSSSQLSSWLWTQFGQCWGLGLSVTGPQLSHSLASYWSVLTDSGLWLAVTGVYRGEYRTSGKLQVTGAQPGDRAGLFSINYSPHFLIMNGRRTL